MSNQIRAALSLRINHRFFYGWLMLGVGAVGLFASGPAQSHTFSVFITPISVDLGISRTALSTAYAAATLLAALGLPCVGRLVDRYGVRMVMLWVTVLFGACVAAFGFVTNLLLLAVGFALLRFLGQGSLMLTCNNLVAQWFSRKRGLALSLMGLGFSLSMAVHPPLAQWLMSNQVGWREAWMWLGISTWGLLLPCAALLVQNKPEDLGLLPDGPSGEGAGENSGQAVDAANAGLTLKQAMRTSAFWICAVAVSTTSFLITGMFFHQVSILGSQGLSPQVASLVFAISAATMVASMPVAGRMLDRFSTQAVFVGVLLLMSCSVISLAAVTGIASAVAYGIVLGIANAGNHTLLAFVWPRFFGRKHLGSIQGVSQTVGILGASVGPVPFGVAYDVYGSYTGALIAFAVLPALCAVSVMFIEEPLSRESRRPPY